MAFTEVSTSITGNRSSTLVTLHGAHDCSSADDLRTLLRGATAVDSTDLVVDLHDVNHMDASILTVLLGVGTVLDQQGRSLALRAPSRLASRILDVCGLTDLVEVEVAPFGDPDDELSRHQ